MSKKPRSLTGKVVVITGGARGIGRSTAAALVAEGARVVIADLDLELTQQAARELGGGTLARRLDVTDHEQFTALLSEVESTLGPLDVLVNNAGVMGVTPFVEDTFESTYRQFAVNVFAVMHGSREAIKLMLARGAGHVVNVASMGGVVPMPGAAAYCASKHAVVGLCEALRWELEGTGIDLSYVLPALVNTELAADVKRTRASNVIEPSEVAAEIVGALKKPKLAVYVPSSLRPITRFGVLMPVKLGDALMRATGSDHLITDSLGGPGRAAYEARVAASAPAAERARSTG
jgi:NAD(P)-dependent dehydrogenase (short-subunit alcohol dehydrogenase family)